MQLAGHHLNRRAAQLNRADRSGQLVVAKIFGIAKPQLPAIIPPPAAHFTALKQRAKVAPPDRYLSDLGAQVDGRDARGHLIIADILGMPEPELPVRIPAPAAKRAVRENRAGIIFTGANRLDLST